MSYLHLRKCGVVPEFCALDGPGNAGDSANCGRASDLSGVWNGNAASPFVKSEDPLTANLSSRDGTLLNFERDGTLIRRANPNKPLYKPEFWEKVQKLDQNGNTEDPSFGCMPAGVPRMGHLPRSFQTPTELIFLHVSGGAQGWGDTFRVIPMMADPTPPRGLDGRGKGITGPLGGRYSGHRHDRFQRHELARHRRLLHSENMRVIERLHREGDTLTCRPQSKIPTCF